MASNALAAGVAFGIAKTVNDRTKRGLPEQDLGSDFQCAGSVGSRAQIVFTQETPMKTCESVPRSRLLSFCIALPLLAAAPMPASTPAERGLRDVVAVSELHRGPLGAHRLAMTFDAGGEADAFPSIVAALASARVRSTFFLTGEWMQKHPELVAVLVREGHEIGNHTRSHRDLTRLDDAEIRAEFKQTAALLAQHSSRTARRWWRAPFGERDRRVLRIANSLGLVSVYWTLDSLDSVAPPKSSAFLIERIAGRSDAQLDGAIILMHVGETATAEALPEVLRTLQRRGFEIGTVSSPLSHANASRAGSSRTP